MRGLKRLRKFTFRSLARLIDAVDNKQLVRQTLMSEEYLFQIQRVAFVGSRALLHSCDIHVRDPISSSAGLPDLRSLFQQDGNNRSVYICSEGLPNFVRQLRGNLLSQFTLVSGDSDLSVSQALPESERRWLLAHPKLSAWFAQNCDVDHPRLHPIPIGLDYHTAWSNPSYLGCGFVSPLSQQAQLFSTRHQAKPWHSRAPLIYADWVKFLDRGDRRHALASIPCDLHFVQEMRLSRDETWTRQSQCQFVSSPAGGGLDCHRTWEAMALGCVPIVRSSPLNKLFKGLPVLIVQDWSDLSEDLLRSWSSDHHHLIGDSTIPPSLTLSYWQNAIATYKRSSGCAI